MQCFKECEYCGTRCIGMPEMADCVKACFDCAATCQTCVTLMAHESPLHRKMCGLCAEACRACAAECEKHDAKHCQDCAQACRRCAEECERMAQMMA